jgi:outer membrane PBP1 activator LpoA protein
MNDNQFTSALYRAARTITLMTFAALAACTSQTTTTRPTADTAALEQRARASEEAGNFAAAADLYTQLAGTVSGTSRSGYLLEAARLSADSGDTALARRRVTEARSGANAAQQQTSAVLLARLELIERRPQGALDMLAAIPPPLAEAAQRDAAAIRGQALFQLGRPVDAVRVLTEREVWLGDADAIIANQRMIWDGFRQYPVTTAPAPTGDTIIDGWLALAPLATTAGADLRRALLGWRQTYTTHPAAAGLLAELLAAQRTTAFPTQLALLLPLSSPQRDAALAIRDGFLAAHLRNSANTDTEVRVYDSTGPGIQEAYLRAQLDGADFIVGPLFQPEVDQVIGQAGFVPTLALNFSTGEAPFLNSFYQFALVAEDEARAIAAGAIAAGARNAIALVPNTQRGFQLRDDFQAAFAAGGGQLVDWTGYEPALQDFSQPTAALLNVTSSRERHRRLAANLGVAVQFPEPRRREDVDMIFMVADSRTARLLAAQLRFFAAGDIPTYATSSIYDPARTARDTDLNGFMFPDTSALIAPDEVADSMRAEVEAFWPQRLILLRLYGMGFDAYRLVGSLYADDASVWPVRGMSGDLSLDAQGRVHRALPLAQFRNGRPVAVEAPSPIPINTGLIGQR